MLVLNSCTNRQSNSIFILWPLHMTLITQHTVFIVSDHTGVTAEALCHSLLSQFKDLNYRQVCIPFIDDEKKAQLTVERINATTVQENKQPIIFGTLTNPNIRNILKTSHGLYLDVFDHLLTPLEAKFDQASSGHVGRSHGLNDTNSYETRIDAVNFAMHCDDGLHTRDYNHSEIILIGISRSGKTPTGLYLGLQFGINVANYPLVDDDLLSKRLPKSLSSYRDKLCGLTIDPLRLHRIRSKRRPDSTYAALATCEHEVSQSEAMFRANDIPYVNTTAMSIEEISAHIIDTLHLERRLY